MKRETRQAFYVAWLINILGRIAYRKAAEFFEWPLQKGSIPEVTLRQKTNCSNNSVTPTDSINDSPLQMPSKRWQAGGMVADSQLLRAEEGLVPFDSARQPDLDNLNAWLDDTRYSLAVRLVTGVGGLGKTRLALELCQQRLKSNWHVGILDTILSRKTCQVPG
ncbi:MAG: hypothetical protein IPH22_12195 [Nitrosomonas sp.]|nr:hypothetical protein [Nitrosomonas sp.]